MLPSEDGRVSFTVFYMNPGATPEVCDIVRAQLPEGWHLLTPRQPSNFDEELAQADFIVIANDAIDAEHLQRAPRLKMIQHQGVGYEKIDLAACRERRIPVGLTPEGTSIGVAEHTLLLILAVYKQLVTAANGVSRGEWMQWSLRQRSFELCGKTLGLIGFGRIGREVAKRALAFDARIIFADPLVNEPGDLPAERCDSIDELLAKSDIVSLHVPLTPESHRLIDARTLGLMKPGSILINTARGGLVDEAALVAALQSGHLGGAGLDVFATEPLPRDHPLITCPNVILTPHIAAGTRDALQAKMQAVFTNLLRYTRGEPLHHLVPELKDLVPRRS